ncbi:GntG family PLP-dependent aldolase [Mesorhizobium sp. J18]|uniref:threonine aldolase family protein n=1 Tax=Mesorhizobium sp. J18 TaxID=935263 RepID=UPI001645ED22|nr:GntG family PLP-dependent aldolase [Mesorhizobium sp. J18]
MIDLRTDFTTRPTAAMIDAMVAAASDRPGFGLRDDPHVRALESEAAHMLGKEDALFCATCTAANQIAIAASCAPGDALATDATSHILTSEGGAVAAVAGVTVRPVPATRGTVDLAALAAAMGEGDDVQPRTRMLVLENTHVRSGGCVVALAHQEEAARIARDAGASVHLDGSRLFNAAAGLGISAARLARDADSVAVSLNKGLAAPMGAILAGSAEFIRAALRVRHRLGGSWRPAGIPAAAALVGLRTMVDRIGEDHRTAKALAEVLAPLNGLRIDPDQVQTNMVLVDLDERLGPAVDAAQALASRGVLALPFGPRRLRLVTSYEVGAADLPVIADAFRSFAASA